MNWGMSPRLGPVCYKVTDDDPFLGREIHQHRQFSEHTMEAIDEEVVNILTEASQRATKLLQQRQTELTSLAEALVSNEELDRFAIEAVIGPSVHKPTHQATPPPPVEAAPSETAASETGQTT